MPGTPRSQAARGAEDEHLAWAEAWVDAAYERVAAASDFRQRPQQVALSKALAHALLRGRHLLAEAPTGTGKTLAYLLGGLAARATREQHTLPERPLIISTATIALQQQLLKDDLPRLEQAGLFRTEDAVLAKGRGNFICRRAAESVLESARELRLNPECGYIDDEYDLSDPAPLERMVNDLKSGRWNGDLTSYPTRPNVPRRQVTVHASTCVEKQCSYHATCGYVAMRKAIPLAKVLIANHDLLLAHWATAAKGLETVLSLAQADLVFDEGHHVPHKAVAAGAGVLTLTRMGKHLPVALQELEEMAAEAAFLPDWARTAGELWTGPLELALQDALAEAETLAPKADEAVRMRGGPPAGLAAALASLRTALSSTSMHLEMLSTAAAEAQFDLAQSRAQRAQAAELGRRALPVLEVLGQAEHCLAMFTARVGCVCWMEAGPDDALVLNASPLQAKDVLNGWLWDSRPEVTCAFVSATLRDAGGFEYFRSEVGVPDTATEVVMPAVFDYAKSTLTVASMSASPKMAEREQFREELKAGLARHVRPSEGTLLVFTSWRLLNEVAPWLLATYGEGGVLVQGEQPVSALVAEHKRRVDSRRGNVLAGVATLAEGLDLPGDYCVHVAIVALPFAVPTTPLEQEMSDRLGRHYFARRSLPAATVRLVQVVGRLLRRESDQGRVTVFDHRLHSTGYGRQMRSALPAFRYVVERPPGP